MQMIVNPTIFQPRIKINDWLSAVNPLVGDVIDFKGDGGESYYNLLLNLLSVPRNYALILHEHNIKFTELKPFDTFCMFVFPSLKRDNQDLSLFFEGINLNEFALSKNNGKFLIENVYDGKIIDEAVYSEMMTKLYNVTGVLQDNHNYESVYNLTIKKDQRALRMGKRLAEHRKLHAKSSLTSMIIYVTADSSFTIEDIRKLRMMEFLPIHKQLQKIRTVEIYQKALSTGHELKNLKSEDLDVMHL